MPFAAIVSKHLLLVIAALLLCVLTLVARSKRRTTQPVTSSITLENRRGEPIPSDVDPEVTITPLSSFSIWDTDPILYRPYESQGHVTMGIQKRSREDWIRMDNNYLNRIREREPLIKDRAEFTIGTGEIVNPAIEELYTEIMIDYLPKRYPTIFQIQGKECVNRVTGSRYPLSTGGLSYEDMLVLLGMNVEEDFYFMCPDSDGEFRLRGYIACFPGGFLSPARRGESVREIHQPVPGYEEKLGRSVDRYFKRMVPGQFIGRMNWSLQVDGPDLFRTDGNNYYPGIEEDAFQQKYKPDLDACYLRVEHQTLCALPKSKAIIFCVRSYMTPLRRIKQNGEGPALAEAIESMPEKLGEYKLRQFWGDAVLPWLRNVE